MEDICKLLSSLVHVHGKSTLKEFLKRALQKENKELNKFLEDEIHNLYHTYGKDCCECTDLKRSKGKTYLREKQWARMYEIQRGKCKHCKKQTEKKEKTFCQYGVIADVAISAFDITLLTTLLLHFQKKFNILEKNIKAILCISENRDWLAHDEDSTSTLPEVRYRCNDITVSINKLARACSGEYAKERDLKIKLEKETCWNLFELQEIFPQHSVSLVKKENRQHICIGTDSRKRHRDHEQLQEHFKKLRYDESSYDINQIRTRFSVDEYKGRVLRDIDPSPVIGCLHRCGHLTDSETQTLTEITDTVECSKSFLQTILSKDDQVIENFMESLLETEQRSTHDYILGHDHLGKLMLEVTSDIPLEHPASFGIVMKIELKNRPDLQKVILDHLDNEEKIGDMRVSEKETGSVIISLKPDTPDACEKFTKAYYNGTLRQHIEDYLRRAGVLEKLIQDQVKVVVNISMAGSANAKLDRTIYDKHWDYLIEQLSPKPVVDLLRQKGILDDNDVTDIFRTQTRFAQSNTLLCKLNVKGSETVQEFKNALTETSQDHILRKIQESEEIQSVYLVLTDNSLDASGHATDTTDDLIPMEKSLTDYFQDASYHAPKTEELLITNESVNEQKLRILLLNGGRRALRYTIKRIVLDVNLKNMDEQTPLQFCENDRNMLFPTDLSLPSLKGLTDAGLHTVWTKVLQQNPGTPGTTQEIVHDYLVNKGLTTQLDINKPRIQTMMEQNLLSQDQWKILFPQSNATFRFENIDFELLCFLIHHVFQLQPSSGFQLIGPVPSVVCIGDDLSRLKYHRDILAQKSSAGIDNKEFNTAWTEIRDIFLRLVGQCFSDEIQYLYDCPADPAKAIEFKNLREEMKKRPANVQDPHGLHKLKHGTDSSLDKALSTEMSMEPENIIYTKKEFEEENRRIYQEVVQMCTTAIEKGCKDDLRNIIDTQFEKEENKRKLNILLIAAAKGSAEMCRYLLDEGFPSNTDIVHEEICLLFFNSVAINRHSPLSIAVQFRKLENVKVLVSSAKDSVIEDIQQQEQTIEMVLMEEIRKRLELIYKGESLGVVAGFREGKGMLVVYKDSMDIDILKEKELTICGRPFIVKNPKIFPRSEFLASVSDCNLSGAQIEAVIQVIRDNAHDLWSHHSNLNIITMHAVPHEHGTDNEPDCCVVLFCTSKGLIPLGQNKFPRSVSTNDKKYTFSVKVEEGFFEMCPSYATSSSTTFHQDLKMGCSISRTGTCSHPGTYLAGGTIGPFIEMNGHNGFLTCAHVLFDIPPNGRLEFDSHLSQVVEVLQPEFGSLTVAPPFDSANRPCGRVHKALFNQHRDVGIDAAAVLIIDASRNPKGGRFAADTAGNYKSLGFGELPEFNNGRYVDPNDMSQFRTVVKCGKRSHFTQGLIKCWGTEVRPATFSASMPNQQQVYVMKNQIEIKSQNYDSFFLPGDSGSAVFQVNDDASLTCIGMAIGVTSYDTTIVTPISAILSALGVELKKFL